MKARTIYFILAESSFPFSAAGIIYPPLRPLVVFGYGLAMASIAANFFAHKEQP